jgi:hypothetical protein
MPVCLSGMLIMAALLYTQIMFYIFLKATYG